MTRAMMIGATTVAAGAAISWIVISKMDGDSSMVDSVRGFIVFQGIVYISIVVAALVQTIARYRRGETVVCIPARSMMAHFMSSILIAWYVSVETFRLIMTKGDFHWWRSPVLFVAMFMADFFLFALLAKFFPGDSRK